MPKRLTAACIAVLLCIHAALLTHSAKVHSPTWDEVGHLAAGLSHWEFGRFELYSVNPPLVRTIAAAPVYFFCQPEMDWDYYRSDPAVRSEVQLGRRMIDLNGRDSYGHFFIARLALVPVSLLGGMLCFLWGRELFGVKAGMLSLLLWCFSPNTIAYGSVITPDLASAVAFLGCCYVFWRWTQAFSWVWAFNLAGALAVAMLTKSVWVALPFVFVVLAGVRAVAESRSVADGQGIGERSVVGRTIFRRAATSFTVAVVVALLFVNGFYGFSGSFKPLGDYRFVSSRLGFSESGLSAGKLEECEDCDSSVSVPSPVSNRFAGTFLGMLPVPLPENYLQGIDVQTLDFERGRYDVNWQSYLWGQWKQGGWWFYYLLGLMWKVPVATLALFLVGVVMMVMRPVASGPKWAALCLCIPAFCFLCLVSSSTGLNRYLRYCLPVLPVIFVVGSRIGESVCIGRNHGGRSIANVCTAVLCFWLVGVCLFNAPHHLSYFNEIAGGPRGGYKLLCDSSVDWGQDLRFLEEWIEDRPEAKESLFVAYFGPYSPAAVGIRHRLPPPMPGSSRGGHPMYSEFRLVPGWYVISKNYVASHSMPVPALGTVSEYRFYGPGAFSYFQNLPVVDEIGHSMNVYRLTSLDVNAINSMVASAAAEARRTAVSPRNTKDVARVEGASSAPLLEEET